MATGKNQPDRRQKRYPRPRITGRETSINAAFVQAIIPRNIDDEGLAALYRHAGIEAGKCVYCGGDARDADHLRPIVKGGKPSGFFHVNANVVPACGQCNQSKSGLEWRSWIRSTSAQGSPTSRGIVDVDERFARLERFEEIAGVRESVPEAELRSAVGDELWDAYWKRRDEIVHLMREAQKEAMKIEPLLARWYQAQAHMHQIAEEKSME
ncbi:HNH endonuclease [Mesorhizobium sp. Root172]|uniref:HNH endonuclease n=1 Tax=Mesorhizobium sp. Root172 TaxID=1736481 RepID=UPI000A9368D5|nr:HNH endonuclease [Mesorhizobium sp. Root172]